MALQRFVKSSATGDKFPTGDHLGKAVFVQPIEKFTGLVTDFDPTGEKVVLRANVYDLSTDEAFGRVVFFNQAVVDGLSRYMGEEVVVSFADIQTKDKKRTFRGVVDGTDADYAAAEGKLDKIHAAIEARLSELEEGATAAEAPAQDSAQAAAVKGAFKR